MENGVAKKQDAPPEKAAAKLASTAATPLV
jgi:hypothetical protein